MSHSSKIFNVTPVDVQNRSGYDESHEHILSMPVGTLVPVMCKEIIPNTKISLGAFAEVNLPPMATDFYGRVDLEMQCFFVPGRLLFGGFEDSFRHDTGEAAPAGSVINSYLPGAYDVPVDDVLTKGTLADYLGIKLRAVNPTPPASVPTVVIPNILPFVGYHLIWQEFYRDSRLQVPILFNRSNIVPSTNAISQIPGYYGKSDGTQALYQYGIASSAATNFVDGVSLFSTRQRAYAKDRFTNATYQPQQGSPTVLQAAVSGGNAQITMGGIFSLYSMDQWKRTRNISGRYGEQQMAEFGCYPESYICDRPIYLGQTVVNVYNKSVYQGNSITSSLPEVTQNNPFRSATGAKYGSPLGVGSGSLCDSFTASERGYLYVIASIVPHAYYSSGSEMKFFRYRVGDFASPLLQSTGDEPIYKSELLDSYGSFGEFGSAYVFGYTQRFSDYKWENDKVSGELREVGNMSAFALKRNFNSSVTLGTSFIEIPKTALDEVSATESVKTSYFGAWADIFFSLKMSMPLSAYTIPSLGRLHDAHTVMVENGGKRL